MSSLSEEDFFKENIAVVVFCLLVSMQRRRSRTVEEERMELEENDEGVLGAVLL